VSAIVKLLLCKSVCNYETPPPVRTHWYGFWELVKPLTPTLTFIYYYIFILVILR